MKKISQFPIIGKVVLGCLVFTAVLSACNNSPKEKYIGLQLYSLRDDMKKDVKGTIEKVGQMGYKFVEAAGYSNGKFYGMSPEDFKSLVEANGMDLLGSHSGVHYTGTQESWDGAMKWWDKCIDAHKRAGVSYIVKPSMGRYPYESLEALKATCDYFNAIGEKCNAKGIRFGYHNHDSEFKELEGEVIYDYMLQNTDSEKVMFQLDLYWIYRGGKHSVDYFNRYPGRFENFHVKDVAELGDSGEIDFKPPFDNAKKAGVQYIVVEVEKYNFDPIESVKRSLSFLNHAKYVKMCYKSS